MESNTVLTHCSGVHNFIVIHNTMYIISPVLVTAELLFISMLFNTLKIMYMRIDKLCVEILNIFFYFVII